MTTYTARWLLPVAGPPLPHGTLTVDVDTIAAVEPHGVRTPDVDLGQVALIPGLCNAHTHLDLSGARGRIPPTDPDHFTDWLLGVIDYRKTRTAEDVQQDIKNGLKEALQYGTTLIGDIAAGGASWDALSAATTRSVVFYELIGLSRERARDATNAFTEWIRNRQTESCKGGESPHSPYSARPSLFPRTRVQGHAKAMHLAESPHEKDLHSSRTGSFVTFLQKLGVYEGAEFGTWSDALENMNLQYYNSITKRIVSESDWVFSWLQKRNVERPSLYIHCNYLPPETSFQNNHHVVVCPRTHAAFQHPRHPFPQFLARGVNVALGTDSLASNPDLDLLAEARELYAKYPEVGGETILKMATLNGAKALGFAHVAGSLEPGKSADAVAVPLPEGDASDPYELLLGRVASDAPRRTLFRGQWRSSGGTGL